jgi:hypothetical protein
MCGLLIARSSFVANVWTYVLGISAARTRPTRHNFFTRRVVAFAPIYFRLPVNEKTRVGGYAGVFSQDFKTFQIPEGRGQKFSIFPSTKERTMIPEFSVAFEPIIYRALFFMLNEVGMRVEGAGPKTDALRLLLPTDINDDADVKLNLTLDDVYGLLAVAKLADGLNSLDATGIRNERDRERWNKYAHMNCTLAAIRALEESVADIMKQD